MSSPEVSVLVPVYNGASFLADTLKALLAQSFHNYELIVLDGGSNDSSPEIIRSFKDERIRYLRLEKQGLCPKLNRGIQEASAPLIARNDQDDISLPNRLERQLGVLRARPESPAVYTYYTKFGTKRNWSNADKQAGEDGSVVETDPLKDGCLLGSTMLARTKTLRAVGGFRQETYPCDDWDLQMRLAQTGNVLLLRASLVAYRLHGGSDTYGLFAMMQEKARWVKDSYERRLRGDPEQTLEQFLESRNLSRLERLRERRLDLARLHLRIAGLRYLEGNDLAAFFHTSISALFEPGNLLWRVKRLLRSKS